MKLLLVALLLFTILNLVTCDNGFPLKSDIYVKTKNYDKVHQKGIKLLNSRKFRNLKTLETNKELLLKKNVGKEMYTVFPPEGYGISDSKFVGDERKIRVKKVLPDFKDTAVRLKRAVTNASAQRPIAQLKLKSVKNRKRRQNNTLVKKQKRKIKSLSHSRDVTHKRNKLPNKSNNPINNSEVKSSLKSLQDVHGKANKLRPRKNKEHRVKLSSQNKRPLTGNNTKKRAKRLRENEKKHKQVNFIREQQKNKTHGRKVPNRRLIAARDAMIQDYPYVVSIQKSGEHWCTGSLINQRIVLTTANCLWKANRISRMRIRACSRHYDKGGQTAKILEVLKHPHWSIRSTPDNDVGLILLDRNIKFSHSCHAADLPNRAMLPAFDDAWVTSWGSERRDGVFEGSSRPLQVYHAQLMSHEKCNNFTIRFGVIVSTNFICLAQTGRRAPCTRDTGAPAVSDGIVWGIASWGIRKLCGTERFPAMFSYLAAPSNIAFLTNASRILMSEERKYPYEDRLKVQRAIVNRPMQTEK